MSVCVAIERCGLHVFVRFTVVGQVSTPIEQLGRKPSQQTAYSSQMSWPPKLRCNWQCSPSGQVLACLQILGRGNFYDDIVQFSGMSEATVGRTFHIFCECFATKLYETWIHLPRDEEELQEVMDVYDKVGFTGAVGSTDVTHVAWACTPFSHARSYTGKEGFPTLAYQATVDHSGRVRGVTKGFAGATPDKTIVRYDETVMSVREDDLFTQAGFWLRRKDGREEKEVGAYLIVDGGYLRVSFCIRVSASCLRSHLCAVKL